ncbi:MAG: SDR family oxidoreductase [Acidobacteria bacterium]|nr:SDR family oxidoreductase [Acidobacteriota bacterium]
MRFDKRVVLITGGASGIGKAAVRKFHCEGASVVFADTNDSLAAALMRELDSPRCVYIRTDISQERQVQTLVDETIARFGGVDVLVNNAAIFILKSIDATGYAFAGGEPRGQEARPADHAVPHCSG